MNILTKVFTSLITFSTISFVVSAHAETEQITLTSTFRLQSQTSIGDLIVNDAYDNTTASEQSGIIQTRLFDTYSQVVWSSRPLPFVQIDWASRTEGRGFSATNIGGTFSYQYLVQGDTSDPDIFIPITLTGFIASKGDAYGFSKLIPHNDEYAVTGVLASVSVTGYQIDGRDNFESCFYFNCDPNRWSAFHPEITGLYSGSHYDNEFGFNVNHATYEPFDNDKNYELRIDGFTDFNTFRYTYYVHPNEINTIESLIQAGGYSTGGERTSSGSVYFDPYLEIGAGYKDAYKLVFAPGVGNTAPVPEPETYAMMLAGLGLIGFTAKRNSQG